MTEGGGGGAGGRPEIGELLSGLDPPRSLPESLRQRLEDELSAGAPARPLEPDLDERLAAALASREDQDMAMLFSGLDAPRPLPAGLSVRLGDQLAHEMAPRPGRIAVLLRAGTRAQIGAGVAAACLLVAAVTGIALTRHNNSRPAATGSTTTAGPAIGAGSNSVGAGTGAGESGGVATSGSGGGAAPQAVNAAVGATANAQASGDRAAAPAGSASPGNYGAASTSTPSTTAAPSLVPKVTSVAPASGPATGGTMVTIRGLQFEGATSVHFDTMAALNFVVTSSGQITAIAPPHLPGFVDVTVTTPHGTSAITKNDRYEYIP